MLRKIRIILRSYPHATLLTKIFIIFRGFVCPWDAILSFLDDKKSVLDIGCGHGLLLNLVKDKHPYIECVGFDHDSRKIAIAAGSSAKGGLIFLRDSEISRLTPESFDCITVIDVLYSVPLKQWSELFAVAHKYLKPDGTIIIKETVNRPRWKYYLCLVQEFVAIKILKYTKGHAPILESVEFYLSQMEANRLYVKEHKRVDHGYLWPHYLFVGTKR